MSARNTSPSSRRPRDCMTVRNSCSFVSRRETFEREGEVNRASWKRCRLKCQHTMSRFVRHQDASIRIGSDDSGGTAFDQNFKLFFCLSAGIPLPLDFVKMLDDYLAVAVYFANEQSYAEESRKIEYVAGHPYSDAPDKLIEVL